MGDRGRSKYNEKDKQIYKSKSVSRIQSWMYFTSITLKPHEERTHGWPLHRSNMEGRVTRSQWWVSDCDSVLTVFSLRAMDEWVTVKLKWILSNIVHIRHWILNQFPLFVDVCSAFLHKETNALSKIFHLLCKNEAKNGNMKNLSVGC